MLSWVPGNHLRVMRILGVESNENAGKLARVGTLYPLYRPLPPCGTSKVAAKDAAKMWASEEHLKSWQVVAERMIVKCINDKHSQVQTKSSFHYEEIGSGWQLRS